MKRLTVLALALLTCSVSMATQAIGVKSDLPELVRWAPTVLPDYPEIESSNGLVHFSFSPDGNSFLLSTLWEGVQLFGTQKGDLIKVLQGEKYSIYSQPPNVDIPNGYHDSFSESRFSPDQKSIIVTDRHQVYFFSYPSLKKVRTIPVEYNTRVGALVWSKDSQFVAVTGYNRTLKNHLALYDRNSEALVWTVPLRFENVAPLRGGVSMSFTADQKYIVIRYAEFRSSSTYNEPKFWPRHIVVRAADGAVEALPQSELEKISPLPNYFITELSRSIPGNPYGVASAVMNPWNQKIIKEFTEVGDSYRHFGDVLRITNDERYAALSDGQGKVHFFETANWNKLSTIDPQIHLDGPYTNTLDIQFSNDNSKLAVGGVDRDLVIYDVRALLP